jgi:hypothetical protein
MQHTREQHKRHTQSQTSLLNIFYLFRLKIKFSVIFLKTIPKPHTKQKPTHTLTILIKPSNSHKHRQHKLMMMMMMIKKCSGDQTRKK